MNPWEELLAHATRERVKDEYDLMEMIAENKLERLRAENERFRKALEKMSDLSLPDFMGPHDMALELKLIARAALEEKC